MHSNGNGNHAADADSPIDVLRERGPGMLSMVTDMADEAYLRAAQNGVVVEDRLKNALQIAEKLTHPQMMENLDKFFRFADQLPGLISMATDMADQRYQRAAENGVYLDERLSSALALAEKLTRPEMVARIDQLTTLVQQGPGLVAALVDTLDGAMVQTSVNPLDPRVLGFLSKTGQALSESQSQEPAKIKGIFGLLKALRDSDLQRALGFFINFGKALGKKINS
jgi:uncharacterized protein YjgD (DUF1641 family)